MTEFSFKRVMVFFNCLVVLSSLFASSFSVVKAHDEMSDDDYDSHLHQQIVFLKYFVNKFHQDSNHRSRELHIPSRSKTSQFDHRIAKDITAKNYDSPGDDGYYNEMDSYDVVKKPPCVKDKKKENKFWNSLTTKEKASIILGSIGLAFVKLRFIPFPSLVVSEDTTTTSTISTATVATTASTATAATTTPTTTAATTTPTTTAATTTPTTTPTTTTATTPTTPTTTSMTTTDTTTTPTTTVDSTTATSTTNTPTDASTIDTTTMITSTTTGVFSLLRVASCANQVRDVRGAYKTIRTPGAQVEQCLSITVAVGRKIKITCTSIEVSTGMYVTVLDLDGTRILANPPIINRPYTTASNTLIIKSLASSANTSQLSCDWVTV